MKRKVLGLKEFVIVLLLACVETAIAIVVMPCRLRQICSLSIFSRPALRG